MFTHTITLSNNPPSRLFLSLMLIFCPLPPSLPAYTRSVLKEWPVWYTMVIKVCADWKYIRGPYHFNARALICQDTGCNWILIGY